MAIVPCASSLAENIRIATYNTQGDTGISNTTLLPNLATVIEGVGQQMYVGDNILQLPDIVALQETTSNSTTVAPLVTDLNNYYSNSGLYNYSSYQATQNGGNTSGNGPNALIYNQTTLNLMASVGIGTPGGSSNGEYRQVVRYEFQPLVDKGTSNGVFYVYDCHAKSLSSGSITTDQTYQKEEATIERNDEATLPAGSAVLYVGDFNVDGSTDPSMVEMSSAGQGQAFDPLNPTNQAQSWATNSTYKSIMTESDDDLRYRDDLQLVTSNVLNDAAGTLDYVANSEHAFGNNGSTAEGGNVISSSNTAVNDIVGHGSLTPTQVLDAMNNTIGSDHLMVVADYTIATALNGIWAGGSGNWSNPADWSNAVVPNLNTIEVKIDNGNSVASVVTLDQNATVEDLTLDANDSLITTAGHTLVLSGPNPSFFNGVFNNAGGFNSATTTTNTGTFTTTGTFISTGNFNNSGSATFGGSQNWSSGAVFTNTAGTATFNTDAGSVTSSPLAVNVSGGTVAFSSTQHLEKLNVSSGATVQLTGSGSKIVLITPTLSIGGTLDLTTNDLDIPGSSLPAVIALVAQGYNAAGGGTWNGTGITSSSANADTRHLTALGVVQNNQNGTTLFNSSRQFDGTTPGATDVLVRYTYVGDANLSGNVDGSDYSLIDYGFLTNATTWYGGDFNYDGVVNGSDYTLIDNAFNSQGTALDGAIAGPSATVTAQLAPTAVPEPATFGLLAIGVLGLLGRRSKLASENLIH